MTVTWTPGDTSAMLAPLKTVVDIYRMRPKLMVLRCPLQRFVE